MALQHVQLMLCVVLFFVLLLLLNSTSESNGMNICLVCLINVLQ